MCIRDRLVLLRGLRQGIELARMYTGRHEVVARALRGGLGQHRGLDLEEAVIVEVVAGNLRYAVAQHQVLLHGRTAQIEVAVLQTLSLIHILMDWLVAQ